MGIGAGLEIAGRRVIGLHGLRREPGQIPCARNWRVRLVQIGVEEGSPGKLNIVVPSVKKSTYFEPTTCTSLSAGFPLPKWLRLIGMK